MTKTKNYSLRTLIILGGLLFVNNYSIANDEVVSTAKKILEYSQKAESNVLTQTGVQDLNIISGKRAGDITLFSKVDQTKTQFGAETLKHFLVNPINDRAKLIKRQAFVQKLKGDAELLRTIDSSLQKVKDNEQNLFKFWSDSHKLGSDFLSLSTQLIGADNSKLITELTRAGAFASIGILGLLGTAGSLFGFAQLGTIAYTKLSGLRTYQDYHDGKKWSTRDVDSQFNFTHGLWLAGSVGLAALVRYRLVPAFKNQGKVTAQMLELLTSVNAILNAARELSVQLGSMEEAQKALTYVKNLEIYTQSFEGLSNELTSLIKQLQKGTFVNNKSMVTFAGRVRVAYKKFNEQKNAFRDLFRAIGEIDAYASFARLMKKHDEEETNYCFVEYVAAKAPVIEFKNSWCSTIARNVIVTQSLNLGNKESKSESNELYCPHVYLTAANGAGKSTLLILTAHNTILSQVVGIATGNKWKTTLFDAVVTHVNIEHDTQSGQSAYAVEQERMNHLRDDIKFKHNNSKVVLAIIDEPYKSTKETLASHSLEEFTKEIEFYDKSICLIASHFLKPAKKIEERGNSRFVNLCIPTRETQPKSGVFERDHKIVPGIDEWLQEDPTDLEKTDRYDRWLAYTKLDSKA